jgi:hypothetical protein
MKLHRCLWPLLLTLVACSSDDHADHESPNEEACEHLGMTAVSVTPGTSATATLPDVRDDHRAYKLPITAGGTAWVRFAATAAGDHILFTDAAATVQVVSSSGTPVAAESSATSVPECATVRGRHVFPLTVGTYAIGIQSAAPEVNIVLERDAH